MRDCTFVLIHVPKLLFLEQMQAGMVEEKQEEEKQLFFLLSWFTWDRAVWGGVRALGSPKTRPTRELLNHVRPVLSSC